MQPAGAVFALACAISTLLAGCSLLTGMSLTPLARVVWRPMNFVALACLVLAAWGYKVAVFHGTI